MRKFCFLLLLLFYPAFIFCQETEEPPKKLGILGGYGISFPDIIDSYSVELIFGPGINSKGNRWGSQMGLIYYNWSNRETNSDSFETKLIGHDIFIGVSWVYGKYFYFSAAQGIYVYSGAGIGLIELWGSEGSLQIPMLYPEIGAHYRYSYFLSDIKVSFKGVILSVGLAF